MLSQNKVYVANGVARVVPPQQNATTPTPTPTVTSSITPTPTITSSVTPTITVTSTITPTPSAASGPSVLTITTQPKNNFSETSTEAAEFSISTSITNNGSILGYQWEYYGMDYATFTTAWLPIVGKTSSTCTVAASDYIPFNWSGPSQVRCVVSGSNDAGTVTSSAATWANVYNLVGSLTATAKNARNNYQDYTEVVNGETYNVFAGGLEAEETITITVDPNYGAFDTSWYTNNALTLKLQISDNASTWTDVSSQNAKGAYVEWAPTLSPVSGATKYYRIIAIVNWPFTVTDGSSSASRTPANKLVSSVKAIWP